MGKRKKEKENTGIEMLEIGDEEPRNPNPNPNFKSSPYSSNPNLHT